MPDHEGFRRDDFTRLAYAMMAVYGLILASLGPAMPLLRDSLDLDRTRGGMHFTVLALGVVLIGFVAARLIGRIGRRTAFWGGAIGMASGLALIGVGRQLEMTLTGAFVLGAFGTLLLSSLQAALADRHGAHRPVAFSEANVLASVGTICAPLLVGGFAFTWAGWRAALLVPAAAVAVIAVIGWRFDVPSAPPRRVVESGPHTRLPPQFWVYAGAVIPAVAAEWSLAAWGAGYLVDEYGFVEAEGSLLMAFFFVAMTVGRIIGARLVRRSEVTRLLLTALGVATLGSLLFRVAPWSWATVTGLFVAGLGIANLFPFLLSLALGAVPDRADAASVRVVQVGGVAILVAPQTLGVIADHAGIDTAILLVPALLLVAVVMILVLGMGSGADSGEGAPT